MPVASTFLALRQVSSQQWVLAARSQLWEFDLRSALIGVGAGLLIAWLLRRLRAPLGRIWRVILGVWQRLARYLQASVEDEYCAVLINWAQGMVFPPHVAPLDAVFVEPVLRGLKPVPQSLDDWEFQGHTHSLSLGCAISRYPRLLLIGAPGTGRTTTLAYLALSAVRCRTSREESPDMPIAYPLDGRLPLFVPLTSVEWNSAYSAKGKERAALDCLLEAAASATKAERGQVRLLQQRVLAGEALILVDEWDKLDPLQRSVVADWIGQLLRMAPGNQWVVSSGERGYAPLVEAGFAPLRLTQWDTAQAKSLAERWYRVMTANRSGTSSEQVLLSLQKAMEQAVRAALSTLEMAVLAFLWTDSPGGEWRASPRRGVLFEQAFRSLLIREGFDPALLSPCTHALGQLGWQMVLGERRWLSYNDLETALREAFPPSGEFSPQLMTKLTRSLTGSLGILRAVRTNRYRFAHSLWQAYFAARYAAQLDPGELLARLDDPRLQPVWSFYAEWGDMGPIARAWMGRPDDLFSARARLLGTWIAMAPPGAAWREEGMAHLARAFIAPNVPLPVRQALAETIARSRVKGVTHFFARMLEHSDRAIRAAAAAGLWCLESHLTPSLFVKALRDKERTVREAAVVALTRWCSDTAVQLLKRQLVEEGDDEFRPYIAESLAKCGESGIAVLHQAAEAESIAIRRAAAFGLAAAGERQQVERMAREDPHWLVRTAANAALVELERRGNETTEVHILSLLPKPEALSWLIRWAAERGEGVGVGEAAYRMLQRALKEGDSEVQVAALRTLAWIGRAEDIPLIYPLLTSPVRAVADAAFDALAELTARYDLSLEQAGLRG